MLWFRRISRSRWLGWGCVGLLSVILMATGVKLHPAVATGNRAINIQQVRGTVTYRGSQTRPAQVGDRLQAVGQGISTAARSRAILTLDEAIGSIQVAENTDLRVTQLQTGADGSRVTLLNVQRGQVRLQVRSFTNPNSRLEIQTPSGVASVRGTEFGVNTTAAGVTAIATESGAVAAIAAGQTVDIPADFASRIQPGEAPIPPVRIDRELKFDVRRISRSGNRLEVLGRVNPTNSVYFRGLEVPVNVDGSVTLDVRLPMSQPRVTLVVQNPLGERQSQRIRMRSID